MSRINGRVQTRELGEHAISKEFHYPATFFSHKLPGDTLEGLDHKRARGPHREKTGPYTLPHPQKGLQRGDVHPGQPALEPQESGLVRQKPRLVRENPGPGRQDPGLVRQHSRLGREEPGLVRQKPRLVRQDPGLGRQDPRLVRQNPGLRRQKPRLGRQDPGLGRQHPRLVRQDPGLVRQRVERQQMKRQWMNRL